LNEADRFPTLAAGFPLPLACCFRPIPGNWLGRLPVIFNMPGTVSAFIFHPDLPTAHQALDAANAAFPEIDFS